MYFFTTSRNKIISGYKSSAYLKTKIVCFDLQSIHLTQTDTLDRADNFYWNLKSVYRLAVALQWNNSIDYEIGCTFDFNARRNTIR